MTKVVSRADHRLLPTAYVRHRCGKLTVDIQPLTSNDPLMLQHLTGAIVSCRRIGSEELSIVDVLLGLFLFLPRVSVLSELSLSGCDWHLRCSLILPMEAQRFVSCNRRR